MDVKTSNNDKLTPKANSFSISSILADKTSKNKSQTGTKRKGSDGTKKIAIARQGVGHIVCPGSMYGPIRVTLENKGLWDVFYDAGTEMVITKSGRYVYTIFSTSRIFYFMRFSRDFLVSNSYPIALLMKLCFNSTVDCLHMNISQ